MGLVFVSIQALCLLIGAFSPFTFKVIIYQYVFIAIMFIVFVVLICSFLLLSSCDLITIFSVVFGFLSSFQVCIYYRVLVCGGFF